MSEEKIGARAQNGVAPSGGISDILLAIDVEAEEDVPHDIPPLLNPTTFELIRELIQIGRVVCHADFFASLDKPTTKEPERLDRLRRLKCRIRHLLTIDTAVHTVLTTGFQLFLSLPPSDSISSRKLQIEWVVHSNSTRSFPRGDLHDFYLSQPRYSNEGSRCIVGDRLDFNRRVRSLGCWSTDSTVLFRSSLQVTRHGPL